MEISAADIAEHIIVIFVLAIVAYMAANTYFRARMARSLMEGESPYQIPSFDYEKTMLVLGDSSASGVGADSPLESLPGRIGTYIGATYVENYAAAGAMVEELASQIPKAKLPRYDLILIQIGGNDIVAMHNAKKTAKRLSEILATLPEAKKTIVMSAGDMGGCVIFPLVWRPVLTAINQGYHREFAKVCAAQGLTYANIYKPLWKDPFFGDPLRYFSPDGMHPSSEGYRIWFGYLKPYL